MGRAGVEALVDRCCTHCHALVTGIGALPNAMMVSEPTLNQELVRFFRDCRDEEPQVSDSFTDEVFEKINATGEELFSGTTWQGRRAMRVSVVNWRTSETDVVRTIATVAKALGDQTCEIN